MAHVCHFTDAELATISNALRVAGERFKENASYLRESYKASMPPGIAQLAAQMDRQAHEARDIYDAIADKADICS